ncbi:MAG: hypothetical protein OXC80_04030 [Gammaproteobacteria bacterium]|nr:hypothetical protein [Gammaproteobacteria bacterium]
MLRSRRLLLNNALPRCVWLALGYGVRHLLKLDDIDHDDDGWEDIKRKTGEHQQVDQEVRWSFVSNVASKKIGPKEAKEVLDQLADFKTMSIELRVYIYRDCIAFPLRNSANAVREFKRRVEESVLGIEHR